MRPAFPLSERSRAAILGRDERATSFEEALLLTRYARQQGFTDAKVQTREAYADRYYVESLLGGRVQWFARRSEIDAAAKRRQAA